MTGFQLMKRFSKKLKRFSKVHSGFFDCIALAGNIEVMAQ
jgi:hypothetical protein